MMDLSGVDILNRSSFGAIVGNAANSRMYCKDLSTSWLADKKHIYPDRV